MGALRRSIDAGGPFTVWAKDDSVVDDADDAVWVEADYETLDLARASIVLSVTGGERDDDALYPTTDPCRVTCVLGTGACTPNDADAAAFLVDHPWFEARLQDHVPLLQERAWRAAAQRDRETSPHLALADVRPGNMVAFHDLFPSDWDLLFALEETTYWAVDAYCSNPACPCTTLALSVYEVGRGDPRIVGRARLDLALEHPTIDATPPATNEIIKELWAIREEALRARAAEARRRGAPHCTSLRRAASNPTTYQRSGDSRGRARSAKCSLPVRFEEEAQALLPRHSRRCCAGQRRRYAHAVLTSATSASDRANGRPNHDSGAA